MFTGRTDAEAEAPTLWPPDAKRWLIKKDPGVGKNWRQEEKGTTGHPLSLDGWMVLLIQWYEFEQVLGYSEGQGSLGYSPWGSRESDMTYWLNNNKAFNWLDEAHLHGGAGGRQSTPHSLPVQMLISSRNTLTEILNNIWPNIWAPVVQASWHKINCHGKDLSCGSWGQHLGP